MRRLVCCPGVLAVAVAMLTACTADVSLGGAAVSAEEVEEQAQEQFSQQFPVDSVDCPEGLPAEVGESVTCVLVSEGKSFEMTATATSVEGTEVDFDLELTAEL